MINSKYFKPVSITIIAFLSLFTRGFANFILQFKYVDYGDGIDINTEYYIDYVFAHALILVFFILIVIAITKIDTSR